MQNYPNLIFFNFRNFKNRLTCRIIVGVKFNKFFNSVNSGSDKIRVQTKKFTFVPKL